MGNPVQVDLEKPQKPVFSTPSSSKFSSNSETSPPTAKKLSFSIFVISVPLLYLSLLHSSPSSVVDDPKFWFLVSNAIILIVAADSGMFAGAFRDEPADAYHEYCVKLDRSKNAGASTVPRGDKPALGIQWMRKDPNALLTVTQLVPSQGSRNINPQKEEQKKGKARLGRLAVPSQATTLQKEKHMRDDEKHTRSSPELADVPSHDSVVEIKEVLAVSATEKKGCLSSSSEEVEESDYTAMSNDELNRRVEEFIRWFNREIRQQEWG